MHSCAPRVQGKMELEYPVGSVGRWEFGSLGGGATMELLSGNTCELPKNATEHAVAWATSCELTSCPVLSGFFPLHTYRVRAYILYSVNREIPLNGIHYATAFLSSFVMYKNPPCWFFRSVFTISLSNNYLIKINEFLRGQLNYFLNISV